jgi:hypothetical protein
MQLGFEHECSMEILSKKVKIVVEENLDALDQEEDTTAIGMWMFDDHTIHLKQGLEMDVAEETLFHEMVHAVENELFLGLSERKVSALSAVLYDTLKRNGLLKDLFETLLSKRIDFPVKIAMKNEEFTLND